MQNSEIETRLAGVENRLGIRRPAPVPVELTPAERRARIGELETLGREWKPKIELAALDLKAKEDATANAESKAKAARAAEVAAAEALSAARRSFALLREPLNAALLRGEPRILAELRATVAREMGPVGKLIREADLGIEPFSPGASRTLASANRRHAALERLLSDLDGWRFLPDDDDAMRARFSKALAAVPAFVDERTKVDLANPLSVAMFGPNAITV